MKKEKVVVDGAVLENITHFYKSGEVEYVLNFKDDKPHGVHKRFNKEGSLLNTVRSKEGKSHGKCTWSKSNIFTGGVYYFSEDLDITEEVVEFLNDNPPIDGLYPSFVEGYFKLKYGLSLEELDINVQQP